MAEASIGLRKRKRDTTRAALIDAALRLFDEQGYDATNVDQIADAADVSARTFHRYFPNKEDVLFAGNRASQQRFAEALANRPRNEHVFISLREAAASFPEFVDREYDANLRARIIASHESLYATSLRTAEEWAQVAAEFVAQRLGMAPEDRLPLLLARSAIWALKTAQERSLGRTHFEYVDEIHACFDILTDLTTAIDRTQSTRRRQAS